jgi:hypothetical protein
MTAFKRVGKSRLPIVSLKGPSHWGVLVVGNKKIIVTTDIRRRVLKEMEVQLRLAMLRQTGQVNT